MSKPSKQYTTDGKGYQVAAGRLSAKIIDRVVYSHAVDFEAGVALCSRVKFENILDDAAIADEAPSCPHCQKKLAAMNATKA